ncbi:MAG TPA: hypothetical protein VGN97_13995 [Mesorhizobium sp.]|jgi:prepilin signal peptidase PulO-like enzyme (type II secretory pathway)|nr:hypothetical protein [Mesorhizobium sp.]
MIWNLDAAWLLMAVAAVMVMAFFFGTALHAVMGEDGFGPNGNMILFTAGFMGAIVVANLYGVSLRDLKLAAATGLGGAFSAIGALALAKAGLTRLTT